MHVCTLPSRVGHLTLMQDKLHFCIAQIAMDFVEAKFFLRYWSNLPLPRPAVSALIYLILFIIIDINSTAVADINQDRDALITFQKSADPKGYLLKNWTGDNPCMVPAWDGIRCNKGRVWHVILESMHLGGQIVANSIGNLDQLRRISLKDNMLSGAMPPFQSPFLRAIWLSNNSLTGSIPDIFSRTPRLNKLVLSYNKLSGGIPASLTSIARLESLLFDHNQLTGPIPAFTQESLQDFDVAYNDLDGPIPSTAKMQTFLQDSYVNNEQLCGPPLSLPCTAHPASKKKGLSSVMKIFLIVVADIAILCFLSLLAVYCYRKIHRGGKTWDDKEEVTNDPNMLSMEETGKTYDKVSRNEEISDAEKSKLVVFNRPGRMPFDLEELLRASTEILGKGCLGTAYKAIFGGPNGHYAVVVKRLRDMQSMHKKEFDMQMLVLGQLEHPNIVPLLAYYYAKDEKFLVIDYVANGSLFSLLHGPGKTSLSWESRLKIARGVARGMAYLHLRLKTQKIPHGNLKSSNIILSEGMVPKITDFGMAPLLTKSGVHCMVAFKAPEYVTTSKINAQADVYSFGIVLLELLTGKVPFHSSTQGKGGVDLPRWVSCKIEEGALDEIYDVEVMEGAVGMEKESMLELAIRCIAEEAKDRPNMQEVLMMVELVRAVDSPTTELLLLQKSPGEGGDASFVSDYGTPDHSFDSRRSSFQELFSLPTRD